jgi:signal transduction histidine kinase
MLASQQASVQHVPIGSGWVALTSIQLAIALGLFALDILTPFGVADGISYSTVIVLCLWSPDRRVSLIWTLLSLLLIFGGWFFSQDPPALSLVSRLLSAGTIVLIWALVGSRSRDIEALQIREIESRQASESKTAFLANISHELRTPLNAIMGFSELMRTNITISARKGAANISRTFIEVRNISLRS